MKIKSNQQFRAHVISWFLIAAGIILSISGFYLYQSVESYLFSNYRLDQHSKVKMIAKFINANNFHVITSQQSANATKLSKQLANAIKDERFQHRLLSLKFLNNAELSLISDSANTNESDIFISKKLKENLQRLQKANSHSSIFSIAEKNNLTWYATAPIIKNQKPIGLLVLQIGADSQAQLRKGLIEPIFFGLSILAILWMIVAIIFSRKITKPLDELTFAIARLIKNDFNFKLSAKRFGSFGFLANQFNQMLAKLHKSRSELINLNKSYSRFVPHQLLKQLGSSDVSDISLGDCSEREMTVLFCDIRGFTTLSETMSPEANFRFINRYLSQIAPVINKHGGIIDKYLGDGIMALFPTGADDALTAAINMIKQLERYNQKLKQKKLPIIEVGLGLHTGYTMLGTVGTSSRMDATVISDTVNAAARVESMTKAFATQILITSETKKALSDLNKYRIRYIASCYIKGKNKPVTLYEIFNNDSASLQKEKLQNQTMMIKAWKAYQQGNAEDAINMYRQLIEKSPLDKSLFALIERCQSGRL